MLNTALMGNVFDNDLEIKEIAGFIGDGAATELDGDGLPVLPPPARLVAGKLLKAAVRLEKRW